MREYTVVFEKSSTGWCAYYPDLPGLASCGSTLEETKKLTAEGLASHLGAMLESGDPIPSAQYLPATIEFDFPKSLQSTARAA
jgi:predicted RNase H-like HicB family nuclease